MAYLSYKNVGVTALSAAVPRTVINNYEYTMHFRGGSEEVLTRLVFMSADLLTLNVLF